MGTWALASRIDMASVGVWTLLVINVVAVSAQTTDYVPLKDVVDSTNGGYDVLMGGIVNVNKYPGDPIYDDLLCKNYDLLTAENMCKWRYTQDDDPLYRRCDEAKEFANGCGMKFRYHALVWGKESSNPDWLQPSNPDYGNWTAEEKRQIIVDHVTEAMTKYKGQVNYVDVVNEAICDCVSYAGSKFTTCEEFIATEDGAEKCGYSERYQAYLKRNVFWPDVEDYISLSINTAHDIDPNALLGVNEYKFESVNGYGTNGGFLKEKGISMYNLTKALKDEGVPIGYVGCQTHIDLSYYTDFDGYIDSLKSYSQSFVEDLGVEWHFTEITVSSAEQSKTKITSAVPSKYCSNDWDQCNEDEGCCSEDFDCYKRDDNYSQCRLNCPGPDEGDWDCNAGRDGSFMTPEEQEIQAALYAGLMQTCIDLGPTVCTAFQTWGAGDAYFEPGNNPFLFDIVNEPKLSYFSVVDALLNQPDPECTETYHANGFDCKREKGQAKKDCKAARKTYNREIGK